MSQERAGSGSREAEVLAALWAADTALTPRAVARAVGDGLAYTTVQTILTRLYEKGAVTRERIGRAHAYRPILDQAGLAARQLGATLDRADNRTDVLRRFLADLKDHDEDVLRDLLREMGPSSGAGSGD